MRGLWGLFLLIFVPPVLLQDLNVTNYRLPLNVETLSYNLTLAPNIETLTFDGHLIFSFKPLQNVPVLILNSKNLLIDNTQLIAADDLGNSVKISELKEDKDLERILIKPLDYFRKGRIYAIDFTYQGKITDDGTGLYVSNYMDNGRKEWMLVSQMRPVHTRKVFPCFDEPSFRARFSLSVWHDPDYYVVSNMPPLFTKNCGKRKFTTFEESPAIPVFLTGLIISKLERVSGERGFTSLAVPDDVPAAAYSADIGPKLATAMESQLNIPYPQQKTHQVALPRLVPVAMENWGLFNFRREFIIYTPGVSPTVQKQTVARFSAHEVSHTWIGNSVTIAWWDYLWLSEMFAMYLEYYIPHLVHPEWRMDEQMAVDLPFAGLAEDSPDAQPLTTTVLTPDQISAKFMGLTYTKGPGLLRMVQYVLSLPNFFSGIENYLRKYWEQSVTPSDLWNILDEGGRFPAKLVDIMSGWTDQPGYPVVTVSYVDGSISLSQKPFSIDEKRVLNTSWWVPISILSSDDKYIDSTAKFWIPPGQLVKIPRLSDWTLVNVDGGGFFRTNYDSQLFFNLNKQLHEDHKRIPPLSRAVLVDDAVWMSRSGLQDIRAALDLISYLSVETDFIVWKSAAKTLDVLGSLLVHSKIYPLYKNFVDSLLSNVYTLRGLNDAPHDRYVDKVQREIIVSLACRMGNYDCNRAASDYMDVLMSGHQYQISPDVKPSALCSAVSYGKDDTWDYILSLYLKTTKESNLYLAALACTSQPEKIKSFLIDSISGLSEDLWMSRFSAFGSRKENSDALLNILYQNINIITNKYGTKTMSRALLQFTGFLTTKQQVDTLKEMQRLGIGGLSGEITKIESRVSWLQKNIPLILSYFKTNLYLHLITT